MAVCTQRGKGDCQARGAGTAEAMERGVVEHSQFQELVGKTRERTLPLLQKLECGESVGLIEIEELVAVLGASNKTYA